MLNVVFSLFAIFFLCTPKIILINIILNQNYKTIKYTLKYSDNVAITIKDVQYIHGIPHLFL